MFGKKLREANKTIESQREILSQQDNRLIKYSKRLNTIENDLDGIIKERNKLRTQVREQTEADLLMVSMKIIEEIKKGTPKKDPNLVSLQQEQERLRALRAQSGSSCRSSWGLQAMGAYGGRL